MLAVSCSRQIKKTTDILQRPVPGPFVEFGYLSRFEKNVPYREEYKIIRLFTETRLIRSATNKTTTLIMNENFNLLCADRDSLSVKYAHQVLTYYTNGATAAAMRIKYSRVVVFPEFQLRDFYYSPDNQFYFVQLLGENFRVVDMTARKLKKMIIARNGKNIETLPVELTINSVPTRQWRMVYYFDSYGWVVFKEGFFRSDVPNYTSELILQKKEKPIPD